MNKTYLHYTSKLHTFYNISYQQSNYLYQPVFCSSYPFTYVSASQWGTSIREKDVIKSNGSTKGEVEGCVYAVANEIYTNS
jgi:hypothetical protein